MNEMLTKIKKALAHGTRNESGQAALAAALILLVVGSLVIPSLLGLTYAGLTKGKAHESKLQEFYAADSGVEDALWQIKNDQLETLFPDYAPYAYSDYDPSYKWEYGLAKDINDKSVNVTIENVWIPQISPTPSPSKARSIIEDGKLVIVGTVKGASEYQIKIIYYYEDDDPGGANLEVETIGIWLPPGYNYVAGSSNLEADPLEPYYCVPEVVPYKSGQAVVCDFSPAVQFKELPPTDATGYPPVKKITFQFTSSPDRSPEAATSWVETSGVGDISFTWDADSEVYEINSVATDPATGHELSVEAYTSKTELRKLSSAIAGEYRAIGNSLMVDKYHPHDERDTLLDESSAEVDDIPSSARVDAAYLYWSAWVEGTGEEILLGDTCSDFRNWTNGGDWQIYQGGPYGGSFDGHHQTDPDWRRILTMKSDAAPDLSGYSEGEVTVSWHQWEYGWLESDDCLQYSFSGDDGNTWGGWNNAFCDDIGSSPEQFGPVVIPQEYLTNEFRMRFKIEGFSGTGEWCDIDNIAISASTEMILADTSAIFKINGQQVYLDEEGEPQQGTQEITADEYQYFANEDSYGNPNGFSYACFKDVTKLVKEYSDKGDGDNPTGNGEYTVGEVYGDTDNMWSYAAWSLIIIYSSPETKGHQLYLYDDFAYAHEYSNVDFDDDGEPGGSISGFLVPEPVAGEVNAAKLTCFIGEGDEQYNYDYLKFNGTALSDGQSTTNVWNSWSYGLSEDGIDIDTFYVTWDSGLLEPADTSAQIDLPTQTDSWNLVYIIIAFRSDVTTGGTISYLLIG